MITNTFEELRHQIIIMRDDADQIRQLLQADDTTEQAVLLLATGRLMALSQVLSLLSQMEPKV